MRNRNYSTEQLKLLIDEFFSEVRTQNINVGRITAENIARHFNELGREPGLYGRHIRNDKDAVEYIEVRLNEINEILKSIIPKGDMLVWRTFKAHDFYDHHKNDTMCGMQIIAEYLNHACAMIDDQYNIITALNKEISKLKVRSREYERALGSTQNISEKQYARFIKDKQEYEKLKVKYNELYALRKEDEKNVMLAALSELHVKTLNHKANSFAKNNSFLGEGGKRTPPIEELLERYSNVINFNSEKPFWEDIVDDGEKV